ncbi:MAG: hypothetical protein JNL67_00085 [Planctomycetaceae bacterium]|nr:hypothetical protein [Planctomycetaceae bacterium]
MISKTPEPRRLDQARLKWELDENSRRFAELAAQGESEARGQAEGKAEGRALGLSKANMQQIQMLQGLLGLSLSSESSLTDLSLDQLEQMIGD